MCGTERGGVRDGARRRAAGGARGRWKPWRWRGTRQDSERASERKKERKPAVVMEARFACRRLPGPAEQAPRLIPACSVDRRKRRPTAQRRNCITGPSSSDDRRLPALQAACACVMGPTSIPPRDFALLSSPPATYVTPARPPPSSEHTTTPFRVVSLAVRLLLPRLPFTARTAASCVTTPNVHRARASIEWNPPISRLPATEAPAPAAATCSSMMKLHPRLTGHLAATREHPARARPQRALLACVALHTPASFRPMCRPTLLASLRHRVQAMPER